MNNKDMLRYYIKYYVLNLNESFLSGYNNYELVKLLVEKGADVNIQGRYSLLNIAVIMKNYKIVKLLVKNCVDVNKTDEFGFYAFHYLLDDGTISKSTMIYL